MHFATKLMRLRFFISARDRSRRWKSAKIIFSTLLTLLFASGCSVLKAGPIKATKFLRHGEELKEMRGRAPFHGIWVSKKGEDEMKTLTLTNVMVSPYVDFTAPLKNLAALGLSESSKNDRIEQIEQMAAYMVTQFKNAISKLKDPKIKLVEKAEPNTELVEFAITEIMPTSPAINVVGTVAGYFVPGGGLVRRFATGSIAVEGRISDANSGEEIFEFKDRESDKNAPFTVKDFQRFAHARVAIDDWSEQLAELINTNADHQVEDSYPFSVNPL